MLHPRAPQMTSVWGVLGQHSEETPTIYGRIELNTNVILVDKGIFRESKGTLYKYYVRA